MPPLPFRLSSPRTRFLSPSPGFRITPSQLDAMNGNVRTTQRGQQRSTTSNKNDSTIAAMRRLANRYAAQSRRGVTHAEDRTMNLFGTALGEDIHKNLGVAYTTARAIDHESSAAARAGAKTASAADKAVGDIQAGSAAAQAGAKYELQQALKDLASTSSGSSANEAAQAKVDFYTMMLQHHWDVQQHNQDQRDNLQYLRAQARYSGSGGGDAAQGQAYSAAAADLQDYLGQTVQAPDGSTVPANSDPQAQANYVQSLATQYNLGPTAAEQLRQVMYARNGASTGLDAADADHIQQAAGFVANQAKSGQVGQLNDQNILDALGIVPQANGTVIVNGQTFSIEWAQQALAFFKQQYQAQLGAQAPAAAAAPPAATPPATTPSATPSGGFSGIFG